MFSSTRMASSTTTPTDSDSASSVMKLMVKPHHFIAMNVPISDVGMEMQTLNVVPIEPRKKNVTIAVSTMPSSSALLTSLMSSLMNSE